MRTQVVFALMLGLASVAHAQGVGPSEAKDKTNPAGRPLSQWIADLDHADPLVREEAIEVLASVGPAARAAVPKLEKLLSTSNQTVRGRAALALWRIDGHTQEAVAILKENLTSPSNWVRAQALTNLGQMGEQAVNAADVILDLLEDPDASIRNQANLMLTRMGPAILPTLARALSHDKVQRRRNAAQFLVRYGSRADKARAALDKALKDEDLQVRVDAARALVLLGRTDEPVLGRLMEGIQGENANVQRDVLYLISNSTGLLSADKMKTLRPLLVEGLKAQYISPRLQAALALFRVDGNAKEVLPVILAVLKDRSRSNVVYAIQSLRTLGPEAAPAVPQLIEKLKDRNYSSHTTDIGQTLAAIGKPAAAPLIELLEANPKDARLHSVVRIALGGMGQPAIPFLVPLLGHKEVQVRGMAAQALQDMGPTAAPATAALAKLLKEANPAYHLPAIHALSSIGPGAEQAVPDLLHTTRTSTSASIRLASLRALGQIKPEAREVIKLARANLKDTNIAVQLAAVDLLGRAGSVDDEVIDQAVGLLKDARWRQSALGTLGRLGPGAARAAPAVAELLKDPNSSVRYAASQTLAQMGPAARSTLPTILELLQGGTIDSRTRYGLLGALQKIGGEAKAIVPVLSARLQPFPSTEMRLIMQILAELGPQAREASPRVLAVFQGISSINRYQAAETLVRIDPEQAKKEVIPVLRKELGSDSAGVDAARILLLALPEDKEAQACLRAHLQLSPTSTYLSKALSTLSFLGDKGRPFVPEVQALMRNSVSPYLQMEAAVVLWKVTGKADQTLDVLTRILEGGTSSSYRARAASYLGQMDAAAEPALPALRKARTDPDSQVRSVAQSAVRHIEEALASRSRKPIKERGP
jgi:HEAT repeat protein